MPATGIFYGCGNAMVKKANAGCLTAGRFASALMSRNASMPATCRMDSS